MRVLMNGEDVGWVTSGTRSPSVERSILLAYVHQQYAEAGTQLTVDVRGREATAVVVEGPFTNGAPRRQGDNDEYSIRKSLLYRP